TGLSTTIWHGRATTVIGIEPNNDMLQIAQNKLKLLPANHALSFQQGVASQTGLPDKCTDIVTCAQSFHWMEPQSTLTEIARILRPGGVFAAYDYQWPPTVNWQIEKAYETFNDRAWSLKAQRGLEQDVHIWSKDRHLDQLQESGHFHYVKELWLHQQEMGNADRFVGLALTIGVIQFVQKGLLSEDEIGLAAFKQAIQHTMGNTPMPWYFSYHICIGIK
ncbi:MAG: class I SAM-dependent methyltransferase, partial [Ktedonobacteraceae bacterium]